MIKYVSSAIAILPLMLASAALADDAGPMLYAGKCAACHLPEGQGIQGAFPALAGSAMVNGSADEVMRIILAGRGGMPSFKNELDDQALASVVNYLRTSLNKAAPVTADEVESVRAAISDAVVDERAASH